MPKLKGRVPQYRKHKHSGQAVVTLCGQDHYLGPHGSEQSVREYDRLIAEWLAHERQPLISRRPAAERPTVNHVILAFWNHAKVHYRKTDGSATSELNCYQLALRPLRRLYGKVAAEEFGPAALKAVREHMISLGWTRRSINNQVRRIRHVFKWAAGEEMIDASIHAALTTVPPLQRGRCQARETSRIRPVPEALIEGVEPFVSPQVWALIQLQLHTGARPGELVQLRKRDINTALDIWQYRPTHHKTAHHDHERCIHFGPRAQTILQPFLADRDDDAYLFSPGEAEAHRRAVQHAGRRTPLSCGNRPGTNRRARRARPATATPRRATAGRFTGPAIRRFRRAGPWPAAACRGGRGSDGKRRRSGTRGSARRGGKR